MNVGYIRPEQAEVFQSLLLPEVLKEAETAPVLLGLEEGGVACGALAGCIDHSGTLQILSLYVAPAYRRKGGGRLLLETLMEAAVGVYPSTLASLDFTVTEPEQETLFPFLKALGFQAREDRGENIYCTTLGQVTDTPFFRQKAARGTETLVPFRKIDKQNLIAAGRRAAQEGAPLPEGGLGSDSVDQELSCGLVWEDIVQAFLVVDRSCGGRVTLAGIWNGTKSPALIPAMLRWTLARAAEQYGPETPVAVQSVNQISARLIQRLIPDAKPVSYSFWRFLPDRMKEESSHA